MGERKELEVKIIILVIFLLVILFIHLLNPHFFSRFFTVMLSNNLEEIILYINSFGMWAMFFSFLLDVIINALGFLPSIFLSTANGIVFGIVNGIILSWLAETCGVTLSFLLMRTILRASAEKLIRKSSYLTKVDEMSGENGFKVMLIARTIPYFPSGILTALGAVSKISVKDYIFANLIGKFPSTALEVIVGHDAVLYEKHLGRLTCIFLAIFFIYGSFWYYQRRKKAK